MSGMQRRYVELDGLRGLAALSVFFSHFVGIFYESPLVLTLQASPLRTFWDGAAAVDLFFVLSGFVLTLPYVTSPRKLSYVDFSIRRVFRLYPAYLVAIFASLILRHLYNHGGVSSLSQWAQSIWTSPVGVMEICRQCLMILTTNTHAIDPVVWSLTIELRMSLILPLFIYLLVKWPSVFLQLSLFGISLILAKMSGVFVALPLFIMGMLLAKHASRLSTLLRGAHFWARPALALLALCLYGNRFTLRVHDEFFQSLVTGAASCLIIVVVINPDGVAKRFFHSYASRFLGEISYSFYLLHMPLLFAITSWLYPATNSVFLCGLVALSVACALSWMAFTRVEQPGQRLGASTVRYSDRLFQAG